MHMMGDDHGQGMMNDGDHGQGMMGNGHGMNDQDSQ
jgi:hypothetical protein